MAQRLNDRIIEILCEEWEKVEPGTLKSQVIYERLREEGEEIPDYAMEKLLKGLHEGGLIRAPRMHSREDIRKHSNRAITSVNADLLCL